MQETNIFGFTAPKFANVEKIFRKNFESGWEREGAALAVYYKGELQVDLQGGYADGSSLRRWTKDTRTVVFSATKAVGALCVAMLVDRGFMNYSDLVSKHWPEFSQNGKESIRVDWIMNHRAGLAFFDEKITKEDAFDPDKIARIIEKQKPNWTPGTQTGYHAVTYGWLVDQLVRRVDPKRRGVGQFFREEVAVPYGIDFHIGLPPHEEHTVSRIVLPSRHYMLKELFHDPRILIVPMILHLHLPGSIARKVKENPDWLLLKKGAITFNDPEVHRIEQVAALGITKAKDLGKIFALLLQGKLVSNKVTDLFRKPQVYRGRDKVVMVPMAKGHGFFYERHPFKQNGWLVGHPGFGGSTIMMDMENEIVISYVTNGLKTGMGELARTYRLLRNALFDCLKDECT